MKKKRLVRDFDYYIDEYMYNCRSRKLRPKTMQSYEQTLQLFERWCLEEANITEPSQVLDSTIRHYICSLQERGKYTFYSAENCAITYNPARRRDFSQTVSTTTINNYIRNLKAFFAWYMGLIENTLTGNLILTVMLAFAEYERGMIVERTQTGKAVARQDPSYREGRPKKYLPSQIDHAMELIQSGKTYRQVEAMTGISKSTLIRARK